MSKTNFHHYAWEADSLWDALRAMREEVETELGGERTVRDVLIEKRVPRGSADGVWTVRAYVDPSLAW